MSELAGADAGPNYGSMATMLNAIEPPGVEIPGDDAPVRRIDKEQVKALGYNLSKLYMQYRSDRRIQELRWTRNLRQYLGFYDPEVEKTLSPERSRAYPKITRVKCIGLLSHVMDLMFPGDDKNWTLKARPSPDMSIEDVKAAIAESVQRDTEANGGQAPEVDLPYVMGAVQDLADKRAADLAVVIEDQLEELGGDQSYDYVALNTEVVSSGILYGIGLLVGPYAREVKTTKWSLDANKVPVGRTVTSYLPQFEWMNVWDFYPDMSARRLEDGDGWFSRRVMSRAQVRELADRPDFFPDVIEKYLAAHTIGNYRPEPFETELRAMGVKVNVNEMKIETTKYEVIIWRGKVSGNYLRMAGVDVASDKLADDVDAEVWLLDGYVIKATMNPWVAINANVKMLHYFIFDKDDTAPIGFGLPNVLRDTQMSISASARMLLDNASVTCGPITEINTNLLRADQDLSSFGAFKVFYRDDDEPTAQWPAVRSVEIDAHLAELEQIINMFMKFADIETFVGPAAGGDMTQLPSEPMRNAAGASMLLGRASLPFKQIIRNYDRFTQSVIESLVQFNRKFNPSQAPAGEYDVIARGATSLMAKEFRGMQVDSLAASLQPDDLPHVNRRKLLEARFAVRDLTEMLLPESEAARNVAAAAAQASQQSQQQQEFVEANTRKLLSDAFKNIAQGNKNQAGANVQMVEAALKILEEGLRNGDSQSKGPGRVAAPAVQEPPAGDSGDNDGSGGVPPALTPGAPGQVQPGGLPGFAGGGPSLPPNAQ